MVSCVLGRWTISISAVPTACVSSGGVFAFGAGVKCGMRDAGVGKCQSVKCGGRCGYSARSLHAQTHHGHMTTTSQATHGLGTIGNYAMKRQL